MIDPQEPTWLRQDREAKEERDADYWERIDRHMPREWPCSYCGAKLTDEYCLCRVETEREL